MNLKPDFGQWIGFANSARAGLVGSQLLRPLKQPYDERFVSDPGEMVLVEGGTLPDIGNGELNVADFHIGKYQVTKGEWDKVYNWAITNSYGFDNVGSGASTNYPVHEVNWYDVVKWSNAKSEMEGLTPVYEVAGEVYRTGNQNDVTVNAIANGYRLPTDAEWEYAARGGRYSQSYTHSGGNDINAVAWYLHNSSHKSWPVGLKMYNELGLHDMSGNVWEWCFDWHPSHVGSSRVLRGGSWRSPWSTCRVLSSSHLLTPASMHSPFGFRLARLAGD